MKRALLILSFQMTFLGIMLWGYALNILTLVGSDGLSQGQFVVRAAGILIPPLGTFMGYFG